MSVLRIQNPWKTHQFVLWKYFMYHHCIFSFFSLVMLLRAYKVQTSHSEYVSLLTKTTTCLFQLFIFFISLLVLKSATEEHCQDRFPCGCFAYNLEIILFFDMQLRLVSVWNVGANQNFDRRESLWRVLSIVANPCYKISRVRRGVEV